MLDLFFRLRPLEPVDERILIVGIDEADLQTYGFPIPDQELAQLLQTLNAAKPRAIGLDLYRDLPTPPGHRELTQALQTIPNLVGIEKVETDRSPAILPPPPLQQRNMVGFNNVEVDADGRVRRGLLYNASLRGNQLLQAFALKLSLIYLEPEGITPEAANRANDLQLGRGVFYRFRPNDGGYVRALDGGYQFLANPRGPAGYFDHVSMQDVLSGRISTEQIQGRIVLIGSMAPSVKDRHLTSHSYSLLEEPKYVYGVELQANFISQILSSALEGRPEIRVWPDTVEWLWIFLWAWFGAQICWHSRSAYSAIATTFGAAVAISIGAYLMFLLGWWIPVVPGLLSLGGSTSVVIAYLAYCQGELKRSTEFLKSVINTIPDPVYVKNVAHEKVVINPAYCQLIGYPEVLLMGKTDYEVFPSQEADTLWQKDEEALHSYTGGKCEEKLTSCDGTTYLTEIKRSLHRDAAGNVFLVGVIRDITERKQLEENLKQLAADLERSNAALKISAEHDPLTGLPNRKLFYERLEQSLTWAEKYQKSVALLFLDLNEFKSVNDTMGHHIGDLLLRTVAQRLQKCLRSSDTVCRLGGDEFTVILPGVKNRGNATRVAQKILETVAEEATLEEHTLVITTSIGISLYPSDTCDLETLIQQADAAMYKAKKLGKNRYEFAEDLSNAERPEAELT